MGRNRFEKIIVSKHNLHSKKAEILLYQKYTYQNYSLNDLGRSRPPNRNFMCSKTCNVWLSQYFLKRFPRTSRNIRCAFIEMISKMNRYINSSFLLVFCTVKSWYANVSIRSQFVGATPDTQKCFQNLCQDFCSPWSHPQQFLSTSFVLVSGKGIYYIFCLVFVPNSWEVSTSRAWTARDRLSEAKRRFVSLIFVEQGNGTAL